MNDQFKSISRRRFLRWLALTGAGAALAACGGDADESSQPPESTSPKAAQATATPATSSATATSPKAAQATATDAPLPTPETAYLSIARGEEPAALTMAALAAIGGIERFVQTGADVIIKPNICTDYYPYEYGATTNPYVVGALVSLCLGAGAGRVRVMDTPFGGTPDSAYSKSGIADAVAEAGGEMEVMNRNKFVKTPIPEGQSIQEWSFYQAVLDADVLINVPIAKDHSLSRLSLGAKNLLGVITNPAGIHSRMGPRIADLVSLLRPELTVVDATRTLMRNGPTGGNLDDVRLTNTLIASHDIVAADAYAATLFDMSGSDISYIQACADRDLGTLDLDSIKIEEIAV